MPSPALGNPPQKVKNIFAKYFWDAGYFTSFNNITCGGVVRLKNDGSVDETFNAGGSGADDRVWNIFKQTDNSQPVPVTWWSVLGAFKSFNGSPRQCLATLDANGNLTDRYPLFTTSYLASTPPKVYAIQDSRDGIYIAGTFAGYGGKLHQRVARVNFDGTPDASFRAGIGGVVNSISRQEDGKLLVAGHSGLAPVMSAAPAWPGSISTAPWILASNPC